MSEPLANALKKRLWRCFNITEMTREELKSTIERYCENKDFETAKNYICTHGPALGLNLEEELRKIENFIKTPEQQPVPVPSVENEEKEESE